MKRILIVLLFFTVACQSISAEKKNEKPNVLFFLVDDLGWNDIGYNGSQLYETPNIDQLAKEAMYFSSAYCAYPRCVPSRHAMMTGLHPARDGNRDGGITKLEMVTLGEAMQKNGYGTFFAGKWHLGHDESTWPHHQGFDVNKGGCDAGAPGSYFFPFHKASASKNNVPYYGLEEGVEGEYITDRLTDEAVKYIEENNPKETGKPFLVYLAHYAVHTPLQAKADRIKYYEEKIKTLSFEGEPYVFGPDGRAKMWQDNAIYAAMVESMDESLGRVVDKLKELKLYKNTIIIFTSDHGGLSNSGLENKRELATTNKPLRAGKGHNYEGGIRVPVFVRWPGVADRKSVNASPITGMDYFPTILEMCGLPQYPNHHRDGESFASAIKGAEINADRSFFWHQTAARPTSTGDHNSSVIKKGRFKLHHFLDDDRLELYDLESDPYEKVNMASMLPTVVTDLKNKLDAWKNEVKAAEVKSKSTKVVVPEKSTTKFKNGSFEEKLNGWSLNGRNGTKINYSKSEDAVDGIFSAKINVKNSANKITNAILISDAFEIDRTKSYDISFHAKCNSEEKNIKLQVQFIDAKGEVAYNAKIFKVGTLFQKYQIEFKPKKDFDAMKMSIRFQLGASDGEYFLDNVQLNELK